MAAIQIDETRFTARYQARPDTRRQRLWTFSIAEKHVCFWGRYPEAAAIAVRDAQTRGLDRAAIALVDWTHDSLAAGS